MSPILGSNVCNLIYGRVYDSHSVRPPLSLSGSLTALIAQTSASYQVQKAINLIRSLVRRGGSAVTTECYLGLACYRPAFYVTIVACSGALGLSLFAGWRREKGGREREKERMALGV